MRRILAFLVATVDGYYEGPHQEFDWPVVDQEFEQFALEQLDEVGTLLFGRVTYEGMAAYWPTPAAAEDDPRIAAKMNGLPKLVASTTLEKADWNNSTVIRDDVAGEVTRLKQRPGKDIAVFGSSKLTVDLLRLGLVDELRIMVNPVVLGAGRSLFRTAPERIRLELLSVRQFRSGNVLLTYRPVAAAPGAAG
jgi:dihydrofolate reductase